MVTDRQTPPYIELSLNKYTSTKRRMIVYSSQTSQIQALEEGSAWTCIGEIPQGSPPVFVKTIVKLLLSYLAKVLKKFESYI